MTHTIHHLPVADIDARAMPRDRTTLAPEPLAELVASIDRTGLRQPIEVFPTDDGFVLISGLRRLTAYRDLAQLNPDRYATIPAFIRQPRDVSAALTQMIEENDIRAEISPWDQGRIAIEAVEHGLYTSPDDAVAGLYPNASRQRRARIRAIATVVEAFSHLLVAPETLNQRQLLRLAAACREGFEELITHTLQTSDAITAVAQWSVLENVLREAALDARTPEHDPRPGYPRRRVRLSNTLAVRREMALEGWTLRFTGKDATGMLMESIMDEVERLVGR